MKIYINTILASKKDLVRLTETLKANKNLTVTVNLTKSGNLNINTNF